MKAAKALFITAFFLSCSGLRAEQFLPPEIQKPSDSVLSCPKFGDFSGASAYPDLPKTLKDVHQVSPDELPGFSDDMDKESLSRALDNTVSYWKSKPSGYGVKIAGRIFSASRMLKTALRLKELLLSETPQSEKRETLKREFLVFKSAANDGSDKIIVTGYYEPEIPMSLSPDEEHPFPIYFKPPEVVKIPRQEQAGFAWGIIGGDGNPSRYYTSGEINSGKIGGRNLEIAWSDHPAQIMLLQIQGSGIIKTPEGKIKVGFSGANGWPFKSVQRLLMECGEIPSMNFRDFISYLTLQPRGRELRLVNLNPRYIFFRRFPPEHGPFGAMGYALVPGRSVATDPDPIPYGTVMLLKSRRPVAGENGQISDFRHFSRFVSSQDTGSAIRGPGRLDLFWGSGKKAEIESSSMKEEGELFLFVIKDREGE